MSNIPAHLLTPRDWQAEAVAHAARECGTPEGRRALAEATRYGALADRLADLQAALDAEHAQRIALQHHAADQAQRASDLEAEIERITEAGRVHIRRAAALEAQRDELAAQVPGLLDERDELKANLEESDALSDQLADILRRTAIAVRGPEPELTRWSWHDVPDRVAAAIAALGGAVQAAAEAMRERDRLAARLDAIEQAADLEALVADLLALDVRGCTLGERLQFSDAGRDLLARARAVKREGGAA